MEIPTETCTHDLKKMLIYSIISFVSGFSSKTFRRLHQFRFFRYGRFVLFFCYANVTVLIVRMKNDRFLQIVAEHVTIIWPVLF